MAKQLYYHAVITEPGSLLLLEADTVKHLQVLRKQNGDEVLLTDGIGNIAEACITEISKKNCTAEILLKQFTAPPIYKNCIAISPLKNTSRFEWFLEKSTELGIAAIYPLICDHTEKTQIKTDRLKQIILSAMLQSKQAHLPVLHAAQKIEQVVATTAGQHQLVAHCAADDRKLPLEGFRYSQPANRIVFIGPEGDFSTRELEYLALHGTQPVSLGNTRLRTETAGIYAASILRSTNF